ncbi:MAG: hypothetical protein HUU19_13775 [Phycisphaerales bacterium]|nr:hypothetical protein [Phycisphaerales bacterium]
MKLNPRCFRSGVVRAAAAAGGPNIEGSSAPLPGYRPHFSIVLGAGRSAR